MTALFAAQIASLPLGDKRLSPQTMTRYLREWATKYHYIPFIKAGPGKGSVAFTPGNSAFGLVLLELERHGISGSLLEPYAKSLSDVRFYAPRGGMQGFTGVLERLSEGEAIDLCISVNCNPATGSNTNISAIFTTPGDGSDEDRAAVNQLYSTAGLASLIPRFTMRMALAPVLQPLIDFLKED